MVQTPVQGHLTTSPLPIVICRSSPGSYDAITLRCNIEAD
jgi:hypothetical protein